MKQSIPENKSELLNLAAQELIKDRPNMKKLAPTLVSLGINQSSDLMEIMSLVLAELNKCKALPQTSKVTRKEKYDEKSL